jgi:thiol-disulfide isomerase/thioredoxin
MGRATRNRLPTVAAAALCGLTLAACGQASPPSAGAPPAPSASVSALRAIQQQSDLLLGGGLAAFRARLIALRGHPVIANQWAAWCEGCRYEFPFFQRAAGRDGARVAFLGVDARDSTSDAAAFLQSFPVPYPSYNDASGSIARLFKGGVYWPTTAFYSASGALLKTHVGAYGSQAALDADIRTYTH